MSKFGFDQELVDAWKDQEIFVKGRKGTAVVLVHGWSAFPRQMSGMIESINGKGFTVLAPLLSGHGSVPEDLEDVTANMWIEDVASAIERLRGMGFEKVVVGGVSMGGNVALLASLRTKVEGIVLIGTPVHLKSHLWIWLGTFIVPIFTRYYRKRYPKVLDAYNLATTSYQYYPVSSVRECLNLIRSSVLSLKKITPPILILQTNKDYLVAKYSPWVIFNSVRSKKKKMQWIKTRESSHVLNKDEEKDSLHLIQSFIREIEQGNRE